MIKLSEDIRNARLNAIASTIGQSALLRMYSGAAPISSGDPASGIKLVEMILPADWLSQAASGKVSLAGMWSGKAVAVGAVGYFRIVNDSGDDRPNIQGSIPLDMKVDNPSLVIDQVVTVSSFNLTDSNG